MTRLREALGDLPEGVSADLHERPDTYLLVLDLPGATGETIELSLDGEIRVEAAREKSVPEGYSYEREERGLFLDLSVPLPADANPRAATATVDRGVLELRLPRRTDASDADSQVPVEDG